MCGISGALHESNDIIQILYESLFNLQHRGQEAAGLISFSTETKKTYKSKELGLVDCHLANLSLLKGNMGLAHVRYPTTGDNSRKEIQPFFISKPYGIALAHNGNITNKASIRELLERNSIYMASSSDSELILNLFYLYIEKNINKLDDALIVSALKQIYKICEGSFSIIIMINDYGLVAFRDKYGIRPLVYAQNQDAFLISSETIALHTDTGIYENVESGQAIIISKKKENKQEINKYQIVEAQLCPCFFEYIYFARQESYINDVLVYDFREKIGEKMAEIIAPDIQDI